MKLKDQIRTSILLHDLGACIVAGEEAIEQLGIRCPICGADYIACPHIYVPGKSPLNFPSEADLEERADKMRKQTAAALGRLGELLRWLRREHG